MSNNKDFLTQVKQQLQRCHGYDGDEISQNRKKALDYYFRRPRGDEVAGRSGYVSGDVSAMVEANLAAMMEAFGSNNIAEYEAYSADDEDQAQLESDVVAYYVMKKNNGKTNIRQAVKDALLLGNGILKVYVEEKDTTRTQVLHNVAPIAAAALDNVVKYDKSTGEAHVRITQTTREFKVEAVPPENFLYTANWHCYSLRDVPMCAERHISTRSELIELFPKKRKQIEALPKHSVDYNIAGLARNPKQLSNWHNGVDDSQDPIEWYEVYLLADQDGDGISERRKVCLTMVSGSTGKGAGALLCDEPVNRVPYAAGTAIINPHRFLGISLYDKLKQTQDINTALHRGLMDNVNATTKNRVGAIDGWANMDDLSDGRPDGVIRVKPMAQAVGNALMPFNVPDTSANILANIEHQNRVRSEMGGAALDMQSANVQIGGDGMGSMGLDRAFSVAEQLAADFTDTIASTLIRDVFLIAHEVMREWFATPTHIKANGKWITATPSEWMPRECVIIKPGMSVGERARVAATLRQVLMDQIALSKEGVDGVLVNVQGFYKTLMDWLRVNDVPNPEQYFIDPETPQAQQAMQQKMVAQQKEQELRMNLTQQAIQLEQLKQAFEKYKADQETEFKYWSKTQDVEVEEAKLAGTATIELIKTKEQGKQSANATRTATDAPARDNKAA